MPAPTLTDEDVRRISETTAERVVRLLQRRGLLEQEAPDVLWQDEPLLASLTAASIQGTLATGERTGQRIRRRLVDPHEGVRGGPQCFSARGFSLHAATRVEAGERERLERLCRYVIRPPLAAGKLQEIDDDTLAFTLKTPWSDGTTHLLLSPLEFIEKLAALVPPPRLNLVRYHGVLAPNAASREHIVPGPCPIYVSTSRVRMWLLITVPVPPRVPVVYSPVNCVVGSDCTLAARLPSTLLPLAAS